MLTREEFDAIEFEAALTGDHEAAALRMNELAVTGTQTESMPRAEAFVRVGEQWLLADDPGAAANGFRRAIADGGSVDVDPRVPLCRALFLLGNCDEAYALIADLRSEGMANARACDMLTELLIEQSDLPAALDWATVGVKLILRDADGHFSGIVEERDCTPEQRQITEVNMSYYVFDCRELLHALEHVDRSNAQGEYYLTDCPGILRREGKAVEALCVLQPIEALSINTADELAAVERELLKS